MVASQLIGPVARVHPAELIAEAERERRLIFAERTQSPAAADVRSSAAPNWFVRSAFARLARGIRAHVRSLGPRTRNALPDVSS